MKFSVSAYFLIFTTVYYIYTYSITALFFLAIPVFIYILWEPTDSSIIIYYVEFGSDDVIEEDGDDSFSLIIILSLGWFFFKCLTHLSYLTSPSPTLEIDLLFIPAFRPPHRSVGLHLGITVILPFYSPFPLSLHCLCCYLMVLNRSHLPTHCTAHYSLPFTSHLYSGLNFTLYILILSFYFDFPFTFTLGMGERKYVWYCYCALLLLTGYTSSLLTLTPAGFGLLPPQTPYPKRFVDWMHRSHPLLTPETLHLPIFIWIPISLGQAFQGFPTN